MRKFYGRESKTDRNLEIVGLWYGQKRLPKEKRLTMEEIGKLYPDEINPEGISRQRVFSIIQKAKRG